MTVGEIIQFGKVPPELRFLVIGGYAVAAHGHTRSTFDVDFLARQDERDAWIAKLAIAGFRPIASTNAFAQFEQENGDGLDLMFVNLRTFEQMWSDSVEWQFGDVAARVPSLDHLLALKLHALKQKLAHRTSKDAEDVEVLIRRNQIDIAQPHYEQLFLKHGSREIYETFLRILRH
jgi:hypothetical protein